MTSPEMNEDQRLDALRRDLLTEPDIVMTLAAWRATLEALEHEHAAIEHDLPALREQHGERLAAVSAHEPEMLAAVKSTLGHNQLAAHFDAEWRAEHPGPGRVRHEHQRLQAAEHQLALAIDAKEKRRDWLMNHGLLTYRGAVDAAEQALERAQKRRTAAAAALETPEHRSRLQALFGRGS